MKIKTLGVGIMGSSINHNTSFLLDDNILIDIGSGTLNQLRNCGSDTKNIDAIIVSHFHTDHFGDIIYFLMRTYIRKDYKLLTIMGPKGIKEKTYELFRLMHGDGIKDNYLLIESKLNVNFIELTEQEVKYKDYLISSFPAKHGTADNCISIIIKDEKSSFGYSGDACMSEKLHSHIKTVKNWFIDSTYLSTRDDNHYNFEDLKLLANENPKIKFYAVHRSDYDVSNIEPKNLKAPSEFEDIII